MALKRYMDKLEKGIMGSVCSAGVDMTSSGNLPEGDILKFSPTDLEKFLQERQEVIVPLLSLLVEKIESGQESWSSTATKTALSFLRKLEEASEEKLESERLSSEVEVLEERVESLTNQLEDSRHSEEKAQRKVGWVVVCVCVCVCVYVHTCLHVCMCTYVHYTYYVSVRVSVYICPYISTCTYARVCTLCVQV